MLEEERSDIDALETLFRTKLGSSEAEPGAAVRKSLMRRLELKEFVRFNPLRFNVYYLGGIVAAGVTAAILITSSLQTGGGTRTVPDNEQVVLPDSGTESNAGGIAPGSTDNYGREKNSPDNSRAAVEKRQISSSGKTAASPEKSAGGERFLKQTGDSLPGSRIRKDIMPGARLQVSEMVRKPLADFISSSAEGCVPLKVRFTNRSLTWDSCSWTFGDGGFSNEAHPEWIFDVAGEYRITLRVFGRDGSEAAATGIITVYPKPEARFETLPEKPILPDDEIRFINYSRDAVKYRWEFGDGKISEDFEPQHRYNRFNSYNVRLVVWSAQGCSDSLMVRNAFAESGCFIIFPNAFIPNESGPAGGYYSNKSDESAQIFHPVTSGVSEYQLRIFSRKGILIFETNDISIGWDGYHKGQLCEPGVYVWKVRGTYKNGEQFVKMGDVTLLKN